MANAITPQVWRRLGVEALEIANGLHDPEARGIMLDIASSYERLARRWARRDALRDALPVVDKDSERTG